jgi:hypothetical protein
MFIPRQLNLITVAAVAVIATLNCAAISAQQDFVTAVKATHPLAYFRLDSTAGKSEVGTTTYKSQGGVTWAAPGAPVSASVSKFAKFNGVDGMIATTHAGGVGATASIMAWVNLAELPSKTGRIVYVAGESEVGNDLDLQFESDNTIRFYTAAGGCITYSPSVSTLANQWHMIVATLDTATHTRSLYWDGKPVAMDKGGGEAGKKNIFTIGASPVFGGRNFKGGIEEAALWNRALKATEVASIYVAARPDASQAAPAPASDDTAASASGTGPFATTAKVEIEDANGVVQLKRNEQIAYIFLSAIEVIEHNCQLTLQHVCPMEQILSGSYPSGSGIEHLKFDPNKTDSNYTYTLATNGMAWEAHANPRRPGLKGFCFMARDVGTTIATYSNSGSASWTTTPIGNRGMEGDSFAIQ